MVIPVINVVFPTTYIFLMKLTVVTGDSGKLSPGYCIALDVALIFDGEKEGEVFYRGVDTEEELLCD